MSRQSILDEIQALRGTVQEPIQGIKIIAETDDGIVYRSADGMLGFKGADFATTDSEAIKDILSGMPIDRVQKRSRDRMLIEQAPVAARGAAMAKGVPFVGSYADEAVAAMGGERAAESFRDVQGAMQEINPAETAALQIGTGIASTLPLVGMAPATGGTSMAGQSIRAGLTGGAIGGLEGGIYGYGEGGEEGGPTRGEKATTGALYGTALGTGIGAAVPVASAGIKNLYRLWKDRSVSDLAAKFGISREAAIVVRDALKSDDLDLAAEELRKAGSTSMLADAGPASQNLLDVAVVEGATAERTTRQAIDERASRYRQDLDEVMDDTLGSPIGIESVKEEARLATKGERKDLYQEAYDTPIDYSQDRGLQIEKIVNTRVPKSAIQKANDMMRIDGYESKQILANIAEDGTVTFERLPDMVQLDYITRAMNDQADKLKAGAMGGTSKEAASLQNLSRELRDLMRTEVKSYDQALKTSEATIKNVQAVDVGRDILKRNVTREDVAQQLIKMKPAQRAKARQGLRQSIEDELANISRVASDANIDARELYALTNKLLSRSAREKMSMLLGPQKSEKLYAEVEKAITALELRAAIARNSATARRLAIKENVQGLTESGAIGFLLEGRPLDAARRLVQAFTGKTDEARVIRQQGIFDEVANLLANTRGRDAEEALRLVRAAINGEAMTDTKAKIVAKTVIKYAAPSAFISAKEENPLEK